MKIVLPKSDIMLSLASEVSQLCLPLRNFDITSLSHTRVYNDGSFIDMADNPEMPEYFYYKTDLYEYYIPDVSPDLFGEGFFLCSNLDSNKSIQFLREGSVDNQIDSIKKKFNCFKQTDKKNL